MTNILPEDQREELLKVLEARFEKNMDRHVGISWAKVQAKLEANPEKLWVLSEMERTEGEPDVVEYDVKTDEYVFYDCSTEKSSISKLLCPFNCISLLIPALYR